MDAAQKPLNYGDFLPAKKTRLSQKIDQSQGNFLRVKPRQAKAQQNLSVIDEISALSVPDSVSDCDFVLEEPAAYIPTRSSEIKKFLADDRKSLKMEKKAIRLLKKYESKEHALVERSLKVKNPIGVKLVVIISMLLVFAVGGVTCAVSYFVTQDTRSNAEENNLAINSRTASDTENRINSALSSVTMFLDLESGLAKNEGDKAGIEKMFENYFVFCL